MAAEIRSLGRGGLNAYLNRQTIRAAAVFERSGDGSVVGKLVDVRDVEERKADCPEVILMDEATEEEILLELRKYAGTQRYVAVMITIMLLIYLLETIFG